jgi:hypothetical protein
MNLGHQESRLLSNQSGSIVLRLVLSILIVRETTCFVITTPRTTTRLLRNSLSRNLPPKSIGVACPRLRGGFSTRGRPIVLFTSSADESQVPQKNEAVESEGTFPFLRLHPLLQFVSAAAMYVFHVFVLCKKEFTLPLLDPRGQKTTISWELAFGTIALALYFKLSGKQTRIQSMALINGKGLESDSLPSKVDPGEKKGMSDTIIFLGLAYLGSGYIGQAMNFLLCLLAAFDVPITLGMCTSLQVLLAHLAWVIAGTLIIQWRTANTFLSPTGKWFKWDAKTNNGLIWSIIGGYLLTSYISTFALSLSAITSKLPIMQNFVELIKNIPESQTEQIVMRLKNPEGGGMAAQIVGSIGPCLTG